jgi:RNA polymerase sigma-70 factor, ECF subfamily
MTPPQIEVRRDTYGLVAAATSGDEQAFSDLAERYRGELLAHSCRMLGSYEDAEDVVQETFLRAWRWREGFQGPSSSFRAWLYRIATNACLDALKRRSRRPRTDRSPDVDWRLVEGIPATDAEPDAAVVSREAAERVLTVVIQHLPPREQQVVILRGMLGWSARDSASALEASVASVNSALQRARRTLKQHLSGGGVEWTAGPDPSREERELARRYLEATERDDAEAFVDTLRSGRTR